MITRRIVRDGINASTLRALSRPLTLHHDVDTLRPSEPLTHTVHHVSVSSTQSQSMLCTCRWGF
jgi:hypothetical protein